MALGKTFKEAREQQGYTLAQVAEATHIMVQRLEELEAEDFSKIAAPIYGRGFIKLYAEFLRIDAEPLIKEFTAIYSGEQRPAIATKSVKTADAPQEPPVTTPREAPLTPPPIAEPALVSPAPPRQSPPAALPTPPSETQPAPAAEKVALPDEHPAAPEPVSPVTDGDGGRPSFKLEADSPAPMTEESLDELFGRPARQRPARRSQPRPRKAAIKREGPSPIAIFLSSCGAAIARGWRALADSTANLRDRIADLNLDFLSQRIVIGVALVAVILTVTIVALVRRDRSPTPPPKEATTLTLEIGDILPPPAPYFD